MNTNPIPSWSMLSDLTTDSVDSLLVSYDIEADIFTVTGKSKHNGATLTGRGRHVSDAVAAAYFSAAASKPHVPEQCSWCGGVCDQPRPYFNAEREAFCSPGHRSSSGRALARLTGQSMAERIAERKARNA